MYFSSIIILKMVLKKNLFRNADLVAVGMLESYWQCLGYCLVNLNIIFCKSKVHFRSIMICVDLHYAQRCG